MNFYFLHRARRFAKRLADPILASRHGAPSGNITQWEMLERGIGSWIPVTVASPAVRRDPVRFGAVDCDITARCFPNYPETGVMIIRDALVLGSDGWVFTKQGMWFSQSSRNKNPWRWNDLPGSFPPAKQLKGRTLSIASDWGVNYAHFLLDCLGRYAVFLKAGFTHRDVDYIYCTTPPTAFARKLLFDLGIPPEKLIFSDRFPLIQAEELLAPSCPAQHGAPPAWVIDFLRKSFVANAPGNGGRLYVPRDGSRKIANEAELMIIMKRYGFRFFDYRTDDAVGIFSGCDTVVGPHGAGLVNALFCKPGTDLLELTPSDHCFPFYYTLAESAGLRFSYLPCKSLGTREAGAVISPYDFTVDPSAFEEALQAILRP
jgi:hypothetical protein